jgi:hypothetical protein
MPVHEFANYTPEEKEEFLRLAATLDHELEFGDWAWDIEFENCLLITNAKHHFLDVMGEATIVETGDVQWLPTADQLMKRKEWGHEFEVGGGPDGWWVAFPLDGANAWDGERDVLGESRHLCLAMLRAMVGDASA